jgi:hypothetical protein
MQERTVFDVVTSLYDDGYRYIQMVVGSDRIKEFETLLKKYNGKKSRHGYYNFESIKVVSAGDRDPDAEGAAGDYLNDLIDPTKAYIEHREGSPKRCWSYCNVRNFCPQLRAERQEKR